MERPSGSINVNPNGHAKYFFPITVPPGIGQGTEPEISVRYSQTYKVASPLGLRWSLGGLSSISRIPPSRAISEQPAIIAQGISQPWRLALDGVELICFSGSYGTTGACYATELDCDKVITALKDGFSVTDSHGLKREYGSAPSNRVPLNSNNDSAVEWRLCKVSDIYGNYTTYEYSPSPSSAIDGKPIGKSSTEEELYLDTIRYTSNDARAYSGRCWVRFFYNDRVDKAISTRHGRLVKTNYRLERIETRVGASFAVAELARAYQFGYTYSTLSRESLLVSITEAGSDGTALQPTLFTYLGSDQSTVRPAFVEDVSDPLSFSTAATSQSLLPIDTTGRGFTDLVALEIDTLSGDYQLRSYFADIQSPSGTLSGLKMNWKDSSPGSAVITGLPSMDTSKQPLVLVADLNSDGRSDLIIPYKDSNTSDLAFAVLRANGQGFNSTLVATGVPWDDTSRFLTLDTNGNGMLDIVQITESLTQCSLCTFYDVVTMSASQIPTHSTTDPWNKTGDTVDWFVTRYQSDGAVGLVHVSDLDDGLGNHILSVDVLKGPNTIGAQASFKSPQSTSLKTYSQTLNQTRSMAVCDINGDGSQDLVLCSVDATANVNSTVDFNISATPFLNDGNGNFHSQQEINYKVQGGQAGNIGRLFALKARDVRFGEIAYVYPEADEKSWSCLLSSGSASGELTTFQSQKLFEVDGVVAGRPASELKVMPVDFTGSGRCGWLAYSSKSHGTDIYRAYNDTETTDHIRTVTTSMGLRSTFRYSRLADPEIFEPGVDYLKYQPSDGDEYVSCIGLGSNVVSAIDEDNQPEINSLAVKARYAYKYRHAKFHRKGRGWCGFEEVSRTEMVSGVQTVSSYYQEWPQTGLLKDVKSFGSSLETLRSRLGHLTDGCQSVWQGEALKLHQVANFVYEPTVLIGRVVSILVRQMRAEKVFYDSAEKEKRKLITEYTYEGKTRNRKTIYTYEVNDVQTQVRSSELWTTNEFVNAALPGASRLVSATKQASSSSQTPDYNTFSKDDLSLKKYSYDAHGRTNTESVWSSDMGALVETSIHVTYDDWGNLWSQTSAAGLTTTFTYDVEYPQYATGCTLKGVGVEFTTHMAYDPRYGTVMAKTSENGALSVMMLDEWGRIASKAISATKYGASPVNFGSPRAIVSDSVLKSRLKTEKVCWNEDISYHTALKDPLTSAFFCYTSVELYADASSKPKSPALRLVDCKGRVRRTIEQAEDQAPSARVWSCTEFDAMDNVILKSNPYVLRGWSDSPDVGHSTISIFDAIGRQVSTVRPTSKKSDGFTAIFNSFEYGGSSCKSELSVAPKVSDFADPKSSSVKLLESTSRQTRFIGGQERIVLSRDNSGKTKTFEYDAQGLLLLFKDPSGKQEQRKYNSRGSTIEIDDPYRNALKKSHGILRSFDSSNRLIREKNVLGESVERKYDVLNRVTEISGYKASGALTRTTKFAYDDPSIGVGLLASVTIQTTNLTKGIDPVVDKMQYDYTYDAAGRRTGQTLLLSRNDVSASKRSTHSLSQTVAYDNLGRITSRILPDQTRIQYEYVGLKASKAVMQASDGKSWNMATEVKAYDPSGSPSNWTITGSALAPGGFEMQHAFNTHGLPTQMALMDGKSLDKLVDYNIDYNPSDQIAKFEEKVGGLSKSYTFVDKRLGTSKDNNGQHQYSYDMSGNMTMKDGMTLEYSTDTDHTLIKGSVNNSVVIESRSDAAGRVIQRRQATGPTLSFEYDENDKINSISNAKTNLQILSDHELSTVYRQLPDGKFKISMAHNYEETWSSKGICESKKYLRLKGRLAAIIRTKHVSATGDVKPPSTSFQVAMTDHKGSVTHLYGPNRTLDQRVRYDDYGQAVLDHGDNSDTPFQYEGMEMDGSGLLDFNARMYDPILGRFTTPDTELSIQQMVQPDGMNRMVFENNDPLNHTDPTGHFTWSFWLAMAIGVVAVGIAVSITIATGGLALPIFAAMGVGAGVGFFFGLGTASIIYAFKHDREEDAAKFWKGWAFDAVLIGGGIGAITGAVTGGASAWFSGAPWRGATVALESGSSNISANVSADVAQQTAATTTLSSSSSSASSSASSTASSIADGAEDALMPLLSRAARRGANEAAQGVTEAYRRTLVLGAKNFAVSAVTGAGGNVGADFGRTATDNYVYGTHNSVTWKSIGEDIGFGVLSAFGTTFIKSGNELAEATPQIRPVLATAKAFAYEMRWELATASFVVAATGFSATEVLDHVFNG